ncbi:MAG: glycosyltransferase [Verrucomicrobiota bacterium JB023]|nr:glycosyltransferase [Verrucomicrobiota bacterium JB023]
MSQPALHAASIANERFFPGLAAALASAVYSANGARDYHFHLLDGGIEPASFSSLDACLKRLAKGKGIDITLERHEIPEERLATLPERRGSRMTFAKFLLPELFPHLETLIYLDADVLYLRGIEEIDCDDASQLLAGVRDYISVIGNDCPWSDTLTPAELQLPYLNAGILWMNLAAIREEGFIPDAIALRAATTGMARGDQPVWNYFCRGRMKLLPDPLNYRLGLGSCERLVREWKTLNLHYIGAPKPWLGPPQTHKHFAHTIWHSFASEHLAELALTPKPLPLASSADLAAYRRKSLTYSIFNPQRARHYREAVKSHQQSTRMTEALF